MLTLKNPKTLAWSFCVKWSRQERHVSVEDVCFVLSCCAVHFGKEILISCVCVCICVLWAPISLFGHLAYYSFSL